MFEKSAPLFNLQQRISFVAGADFIRASLQSGFRQLLAARRRFFLPTKFMIADIV